MTKKVWNYLLAAGFGLAAILMCKASYNRKLTSELDKLYPSCGIVTGISRTDDLIVITDFNGHNWISYGVEDWAVGDVAAMIMDSKNTTTISDDEIVSIRYNGYVR